MRPKSSLLSIGRTIAALAWLAVQLLVAPVASAQPLINIDVPHGTVQGWRVGLSRTLGGCLASGTFRDQTTIWIGFEGGSNNAYIALTNPNWVSIEPGRPYQLTLTADGRRWNGNFVGLQRSNHIGLIAMGLRSDFVLDFARSAGIQVTFEGRDVARLSLTGSRAAVSQVLTCHREASFTPDRPRQTARPAEPPSREEEPPRRPGGQQQPASRPGGGEQQRPPGTISTGTGFFVSRTGHVVTNAHVIRGCSTVQVRHLGMELRPASVIAADGANDLALLRTDLRPTRVPALTTSTRVGEQIYVYGFPLTGTLTTSGNFTAGHITAAAGLQDDTRMFQHSAPIQPGNSGGPMMDQFGNISGVIVATLNASRVAGNDRPLPQNVNFAIKTITLIGFLDAQSIAREGTPATAPLDAPTVAERAREFTVHVICR